MDRSVEVGILGIKDAQGFPSHRSGETGSDNPKGIEMNEMILRAITYVQLGWADLTDKVNDRERGATAVEYGLLVALIAIVIIAAVTLLGGNLKGLFNHTATSVHS
jgi:pilus assembly protein Flp/PilA